MSVEYLRRACFLSLFAYLYGEPSDSSRFDKTSLIQFTNAELPLNFEKSIGEQINSFKKMKLKRGMDDYYNSLFSSAMGDKFYDTLFLEYNFQNKLGGECYIFRRGNEKYIVFRGSDTPIDIWIDATIESVPLIVGDVLTNEDIRVHRGFLEQMNNYNFFKQIIKGIDPHDGMDVYIIGHSLGSASGLLQGYYMHHALDTMDISISIVSVGGPVIGTSTWCKSFNDIFCSGNSKRRFDRLINERDIIPNIHTFTLDLLDATPLVKLISSKLEPPLPKQIPDFNLARYLNKYTFDYKHVGYETWIIRSESFVMFGDTWVAENPELECVKNEKHIFVTPTIMDLLNIAEVHMIEYQKWLCSAKTKTKTKTKPV